MKYYLLLGLTTWLIGGSILHAQTGSATIEVPAAQPVATISGLPSGSPVACCPCPKPMALSADDGPSYWGSVDYLLWWVSNSPLPVPLVTRGGNGVLGNPGVSVIYGNNSIDYGAFSGARFALGGWIDPERQWGIEGTGFFLFNDTRSFRVQSDGAGNPVLAQPIIIPGFGEDAFATAIPGSLYGDISSTMEIRFYGWDVNVLRNVYRENGFQVNALLGYRSLRLSEQLILRSNTRTLVNGAADFLGAAVPAGSALITTDSFGTSTDVYAPQIGGQVNFNADRWGFDLVTKVGLGWASHNVAINGSTLYMPPFGSNLPTQVAGGGLLATTTNIPGGQATGRFVVVPEVTGRVGYNLNDAVRVSVGYSFLYISEVVRPGNQIDRVVNPNNVPSDPDFGQFTGPSRPALNINYSSFWAHGVNFGVEIRY